MIRLGEAAVVFWSLAIVFCTQASAQTRFDDFHAAIANPQRTPSGEVSSSELQSAAYLIWVDGLCGPGNTVQSRVHEWIYNSGADESLFKKLLKKAFVTENPTVQLTASLSRARGWLHDKVTILSVDKNNLDQCQPQLTPTAIPARTEKFIRFVLVARFYDPSWGLKYVAKTLVKVGIATVTDGVAAGVSGTIASGVSSYALSHVFNSLATTESSDYKFERNVRRVGHVITHADGTTEEIFALRKEFVYPNTNY